MSWIALRITPSVDRDAVMAALFGAGSQGILEDGEALVTHFPPDSDVDTIRNAVTAVDPSAQIVVSETPPTDWSAWRANVGAHTLGRLTVAPPWLAAEYAPATTIVIDPAMAFGTGEHATTRGVLRLMQQVIRPGDTVADLGAGSAVLAIAAAKLGASRVAAIELDPDASTNAQENITRNDVSSQVSYIEGDAGLLLPLVAPVDVVLANIVSSVLVPILPTIASSLTPNGHAILSGLLYEERDWMLPHLTRHGWTITSEDAEDEWWTVLITRSAQFS